MQLTPAQINLLRSRPHQANIYMSIYRPKTLFACQVMTGTYNTGDINIPYMNITTGSINNLYPDLTFLLGSAAGQDDYGRLRMRYASGTSSNSLTFAENAINWTTGMYLTAIDQIDIVAKYPRIIQDPNNQTNVIFYKDYDIAYTNQNQIYGTFPCAGPHRAGFLSSGTFYFTATGTYNVLDEALTYSWLFEGGTPTGSNSLTPGDVKWSATGDYKVRLRVTSASGAVDDTYRYVSIYDRPGAGTHIPITQWELGQLSGSRSEGGYTASFKVYQDIGDVQPNALVVLFTDNWYGGTQVNLGGNAVGNSSILFVGYIIGDSIKFDYQSSSVEFSVGSVSEIMKQAEGFSVSCESKASPTTWFQLYEMNVPRAIYHYLKWQSTVLEVTDFQYTGDARLVQYFDTDRGSLYDAVDTFMREGMLGEVVTDRQGKLWAEISSFGLQNPITSLPNPFLPIQKQDWMSEPQITERRNSDLSFIELGGIAYYGVSSNAFSALLSNAPSTVPLYHGKSDRKEGLILTTQDAINQVAGNYLAYQNTRFPEVSLPINGIYTNFDIAPQERQYLVIGQNDTVRNKSLQDIPYLISSMDWHYSSVNQSLYSEITLNQIATGTAGVTVEIPVTPPDNGYSYPTLNLPPLPSFPSSPGIGSTIPVVVVLHDASKGFIYTTNFDSSSPQWATMNNGLTQTQYQNALWFIICPNGTLYCGYNGYSGGGTKDVGQFIARCPSVGGTWTVIFDYTTGHAQYPSSLDLGISIAGFNPNLPETVSFVMGSSSGCNLWVGSGVSFAKKGALVVFNNLCEVSYGSVGWRVLGFPDGANHASYWLFNDAGTLTATGGVPAETLNGAPQANGHLYVSVDGTPYAFTYKINSTKIYRFSNNFQDTPTEIEFNVAGGISGMDTDPSGFAALARYDVGLKGKSSDLGTTWAFLPTLPPGSYIYCYAGNNGTSVFTTKWIAVGGGGSVIRFSPDFGNTWLNREGNITDISPIITINVNVVRCIPS